MPVQQTRIVSLDADKTIVMEKITLSKLFSLILAMIAWIGLLGLSWYVLVNGIDINTVFALSIHILVGIFSSVNAGKNNVIKKHN